MIEREYYRFHHSRQKESCSLHFSVTDMEGSTNFYVSRDQSTSGAVTSRQNINTGDFGGINVSHNLHNVQHSQSVHNNSINRSSINNMDNINSITINSGVSLNGTIRNGNVHSIVHRSSVKVYKPNNLQLAQVHTGQLSQLSQISSQNGTARTINRNSSNLNNNTKNNNNDNNSALESTSTKTNTHTSAPSMASNEHPFNGVPSNSHDNNQNSHNSHHTRSTHVYLLEGDRKERIF